MNERKSTPKKLHYLCLVVDHEYDYKNTVHFIIPPLIVKQCFHYKLDFVGMARGGFKGAVWGTFESVFFIDFNFCTFCCTIRP